MELVIWNKIEPDKIDVVIVDNVIKVLIDDRAIWSKIMEKPEDMNIYNDILDDVEKINEVYINGDTENFQKLSEEFLQKLKTL